MAREKKKEEEKQEFISANFSEYKAAFSFFDQNDWDCLDLDKQYRRVYDFLRRQKDKEKKEQERTAERLTATIEKWTEKLEDINHLGVYDMIKLKNEIDRYINNNIWISKRKSIAEIERELAGFETETQRQLKGIELKRKEEKENLEDSLKALKELEI